MSVFRRPGAASRLALAIALSSAAALTVAAPAQAAKKQEQPAEPKAQLSKPFAVAYKPYFDAVKAQADITVFKDSLPAIQAAAQTPDDKYTAGQATYNIGLKLKDVAMQRQGVAMMIESGSALIGGERGNLLYGSAELAYNSKDWAAARAAATQAAAAGYSGGTDWLIANAYFNEGQAAAGVDVLDKAIAKKVAANQPVPEDWLKHGFARAYDANLNAPASKFALLSAQYYPTRTNWANAIAVQRNVGGFDGQELLDLLRLAELTGALQTERDYVDYISAADARRLPGETQRIIKAGIAAGKLKSNDVFVSEANSVSAARVAADTADLPKLASDARSANATVATLNAAGDAFLSYQKPAEAEEFYKLALTKPGVDSGRVLTRLGIAQVDQGKFADAQATFAKVEGSRQPIAQLWSLYAAQGGKAPAQ
jgi:hypothetical protein